MAMIDALYMDGKNIRLGHLIDTCYFFFFSRLIVFPAQLLSSKLQNKGRWIPNMTDDFEMILIEFHIHCS